MTMKKVIEKNFRVYVQGKGCVWNINAVIRGRIFFLSPELCEEDAKCIAKSLTQALTKISKK